MNTVYYEGQFLPENEAKIPISDRGFLFGDGAFATLQVRDGVPLFLAEHLTQLEKNCQNFSLKMPSISCAVVEELIRRNEAYQGIWRMKILITGGDGQMPRLPEREGRELLFIHPFTPYPFKPLHLGIFPIPYTSCHAHFKSLAHLNRFYVMEEAHRQNRDDCITTTETGNVLEAAYGNLFWVKERELFTPDPALPLNFGVTIKNILQLAGALGFTIHYVKTKLEEIPKESTLFRTNTMQGVRPIARIGEISFSYHPVIQALFLNGYEEMIQKEMRKEKPLSGFFS